LIDLINSLDTLDFLFSGEFFATLFFEEVDNDRSTLSSSRSNQIFAAIFPPHIQKKPGVLPGENSPGKSTQAALSLPRAIPQGSGPLHQATQTPLGVVQ
jgi:hypothetical protein